jgi:hypothetical protein
VRDRTAQTVIGCAVLLALAIVLGSALIGRGIRHRSDSNRITVTGSAKKRITSDYVVWNISVTSQEPLASAAADQVAGWAKRVRAFLEATGAKLGGLRGVDVGVFQVTAPNSTEVSDYGVYDTTTLRKDVSAVVNVTFALD